MKHRVLGIIAARGGSKRLPRKNVLPIGGKPLIAWTIEAGLNSETIDKLIVSTDDQEIASVCRDYGCEVPFLRPEELATDMSTSSDVVLHALENFPDFTHFVLLQPTSPLRDENDIDIAFSHMINRGATSCVSVKVSTESPYWMYSIDENGKMSSVSELYRETRKQDLPDSYLLNGAIFISETQRFLNCSKFVSEDTCAYVMPRQRSVDIDTAEDVLQFESLLQNHSNEITQ